MSVLTDPIQRWQQNFRQFLRSLQFVWGSARGLTIANGFLVVVQGILPLIPLYLMKLLVDSLSLGMKAADRWVALQPVLWLIFLIVVVTIASALIRSISGLISEEQAIVVADHMNDLIQAKSVSVDLEFYESSRYFDTLHRAQSEGPYRPLQMVNGLVQFGMSGISMLAVSALLFSFHWAMAIILLVFAIPGVIVRWRFTNNRYQWQKERTATERYAGYFSGLLSGSYYAKELRLFDLGSLFMARFRELRATLRQEKRGLAIWRSVTELVVQASAAAAIYGSCAFVAYQTVQGTKTLGDMMMFYQALQRLQGALNGFLNSLVGLFEDNLFIAHLYEFLDLPSRIIEPVNDPPIPQPMQTGIVLNNVAFQYSPDSRKILEDVSLTIRPGEVVAFVGENGSGKTTLIKLLCRFYDPTAGSITLDGIDLRDFRTKTLRSAMTVIFQDYVRYDLTARENIWVGNSSLAPDDEKIVEAARRSGAERVIEALPDRYETALGRQFEKGQELSVGEWQKIALARAFVRDAPIVVLDEPTSSLDARTEYEAFRDFRRLTAGRTAILISHRFSTVRIADRIFVLKGGKIIESGAHEELMRLGGTYARAFEMQAHQYK